MSDVPQGYKQTEVGVIPEDWEVDRLEAVCESSLSYGINAPATQHSSDLPIYIRITDIEDGRLAKGARVSVNSTVSHKYMVDFDDILLARTGASVGKSYRHSEIGGKFVYAGFLIRAKINIDKAVPAFVSAALNTKLYWDWVQLMSQRSGQPGINGKEYGSFKFPLPPLPEQRAIASALADVDALIAALEELLTKKRQLKQGAMQELLTGRTRLEGFEGEWDEVKLGDVVAVISGGTPSTGQPAFWNGGIPWCTPTDLTSTTGKYLSLTERSISVAGLKSSAATLLPAGAILFCSRASVGEVKIAAIETTTNQGFQSFLCGPATNRDFIYYWTILEKARFIELAKGSTFLEISSKAVKSIHLCLPPLPEQQAIASILSDMDAEIDALDERLGKTRALKQGMMQELLTGRTRLI